jgi:uncharacterized protein (TIGR03086 family)
VSVPELYARAVDEFDARMQQVKEDQWTDPTPCTDWNVHDLVNHIVNEARWVKPLLDGKTIAEVGNSLDGDLLGVAPYEAWINAREEELEAVRGLGSLDQKVHVSWGEIPASEYLTQVLMDHAIHAWDLARAIGADEHLEEDLVDFCLEAARPMEQMLRGSGVYGDHVEAPADADNQTKLLALVGRTA